MNEEPKKRYPRQQAEFVARQIGSLLKPACSRIIIAGSLRRGSPLVGDVEIVYIPKLERRPSQEDFFSSVDVNLADEIILRLEKEGVIERRTNVNGSTMFGAKNKLMRHRETGIPVDLFATEEANWFNYLVCRTGPAESNTAIATAAKRQGWRWCPYGPGFQRNGSYYPIYGEAMVFKFAGIPMPKKRVEIPL